MIDFIIQNGGQILLDEIGYTDARKVLWVGGERARVARDTAEEPGLAAGPDSAG
ncbi:hypothetical protein LWC34_30100 [Kibdelosporangium philippinense]|uniref:Uncharacterized protein n=1 Tax=Kibdelosporangium philippinense TaxID=211113 RepID=A0ABS8ZGV0_9PSEU|nr:hypothetical protein [Kibdelosporangium philippinense]MCE7007051.1 hypothetical protein [Kibdelosporangium philippinense]